MRPWLTLLASLAASSLCASCGDPLPERPVPVSLLNCRTPEPGPEPTYWMDSRGVLHHARDGAGWKDSERLGSLEWRRRVERMLREDPAPAVLAIDTRQPLDALTLFLRAAHEAGEEVQLVTERDGERYAIHVGTVAPPQSTTVLAVSWNSGFLAVHHGPLRDPPYVGGTDHPDDDESAAIDELAGREAEVLLVEMGYTRGDPLKPLLRLLCAGRARVDRVVLIPAELLFREAVRRERERGVN
ncbi:MAG: hypothetical protein SangKO_054520 [Sandaracinaceae bacterium]